MIAVFMGRPNIIGLKSLSVICVSLRSHLDAFMLFIYNKYRQRRWTEIVHVNKILFAAIPLGGVSLFYPFGCNDLQMCMVEPIAVFVEISNLGEWQTSGYHCSLLRQPASSQVAEKTIERLKVRAFVSEQDISAVVALTAFVPAFGNGGVQRGM